MDGTDGVGIIIEQSKRTFDESAGNGEFLLQFAQERPLIGRLIKGLSETVTVIDMSPDPDRSLFEKSCFSTSGAPAVVQDQISRSHHDIGNDLFERGILLRLMAGNKKMISRLKESGQIATHVGL